VEGHDHTSQATLDAVAPLDELRTRLWEHLDEVYAQAVEASESSRALHEQAHQQARRSRELFREAQERLAEIRKRRSGRLT
jgi:hypothetical protein